MGEKGLIEEDWKDRDKWKEKVIVKWAQEDVETSNLLKNNNNDDNNNNFTSHYTNHN